MNRISFLWKSCVIFKRTTLIAGTVVSSFRLGVDKLRVELVDINVGGDRHIKDVITDAAGEFKIILKHNDLKKLHKRRPDLQARVFAGKKLLGVSEICYKASTPVILNITLTEEASGALASEHETLSADLSAYYKGNLSDLKENEKQNDITYLANNTGWDARAVALAALADRFSQGSGKEKIPTVAFYALFRAGLPAEEESLYQTNAATLKVVWEKTAQQGVITQDAIKQIPSWVKQFGILSKKKLLTNTALVGVSSLKDMLAASRLNEDQQNKFAEIYATHRSNMPAFWNAVKDTLGGEVVGRLDVDGKLGFLTINNIPLMQKLHEVAQKEKQGKSVRDPLQLAQWGYHRVEKWKEMLDEDHHIDIPDEIPGETQQEKRENYAAYMAATVRLCYPTASVAEMIKTDKLLGEASDQVHAFLSKYQGEFQIGGQPIEQFIKRNKINDTPEAVINEIKRLQRVYQITPSDQAMGGLLKNGVHSAYDIVQLQKQEFIRSYAKDMGGD